MQDGFDEGVSGWNVNWRRGFIQQDCAQDILVLINSFIKPIPARDRKRQSQKVERGERTHSAENII